MGIICGSGLGGLASLVEDSVILNYSDIPGFPVSTAPGHHGRLVTGLMCGIPVLLMQGRFHVYEGKKIGINFYGLPEGGRGAPCLFYVQFVVKFI